MQGEIQRLRFALNKHEQEGTHLRLKGIPFDFSFTIIKIRIDSIDLLVSTLNIVAGTSLTSRIRKRK